MFTHTTAFPSMASLASVFAGAYELPSTELSQHEWESVLRRATDPALHVRALRLDGNDFSGTVGSLLGDAVAELSHLTDLSVSDARLGGPAVSKLLCSLGGVPAFARPHAEVWDPIQALPGAVQGARLCLMRNGIADADLECDGTPPTLYGVVEVALSGNPRICDPGFATLAQLVPNVRRLHLGRTGIASEGVHQLLDKHWPLLDALALNGTPMQTDGFERLCKAIKNRAKAVKERKLLSPSVGLVLPPPRPGNPVRLSANCAPVFVAFHADGPSVGGGAAALATTAAIAASHSSSSASTTAQERPHPYFHLDLREIPSLLPTELSALLKDYADFSADNANLPWLATELQPFSSGTSLTKAGLVLRHDFERDCTLQLRIHVQTPPASSAHNGLFTIELTDVPQRKSLERLVTEILQAVNTKTGTLPPTQSKYQTQQTFDERQAGESSPEEGSSSTERAVRKKLKELEFPVVAAADTNASQWMDEALEHPGRGGLPVGIQRAELGRIALGSLITSKRVLELDLTLRHGPPGSKGSTSSGGGAIGASAARMPASQDPALEAILAGAQQKVKAPSGGRKRKAAPAHSFAGSQ